MARVGNGLTLVGAASLLAACAAATAAPADPLAGLVGTTWRAETIEGRPVTGIATSTLTFVSTEQIAGRAGCNRYSGPLRVAGERVAIGPLATTRMACEAALMDQEERFLAALGRTERIAQDGAFLLLHAAGGREPTRLARFTEPAPPPR
jgi:heat shock protein HslJ